MPSSTTSSVAAMRLGQSSGGKGRPKSRNGPRPGSRPSQLRSTRSGASNARPGSPSGSTVTGSPSGKGGASHRRDTNADADSRGGDGGGGVGGGSGGGGGGAGSAIADLERRLHDVEAERDTAIFQLSQVQSEHRQEVEFLQKEIDELVDKRHRMQARVDRVDKVENAIVSLYMDMRDRTHELHLSEEEVHKMHVEERDQLRQQNPIAVLDSLRANLRNLLAFKEDYENELSDRLHRKKTDAEVRVEELQAKIQEMSTFYDSAKANTEVAVKKMRSAVNARSRVVGETEDALAQLRRNNDELIRLVKAKEDEVQSLRGQLGAKEQQLKHKDIKIMRISALESQIQANKLQHQFDLQKLQAQHVKSLQVFQNEISKFTRTEAENRDFAEEVARAREEVASYKRNINLSLQRDDGKRIVQLEKVAQDKEVRIKDLETRLRHAEYVAQEATEKQRALKKEYDRLFDSISKRVKRGKEERGGATAADIHARAEMNPMYVSVYKARLKVKEREAQELADKVRRLLAAEHRNKVMQKSFQAERSRYESELASLRRQGVMAGLRPGRPVTASALQRARSARGMGGGSGVGSGGGGGGGGGGKGGADDPASGAATSAELAELRKENENLRALANEYEGLKRKSVSTASAFDRALNGSSHADGLPQPESLNATAGPAETLHFDAPPHRTPRPPSRPR